MSPSEAWRMLSEEDDQSVTTLSESCMPGTCNSTDARPQSSSQHEDADPASTPLSGQTEWGETSRSAFIADPEQERTCSNQTQGSTEPFVEPEPMSQRSSLQSESQTDLIRPDPFAVPEECHIPGEVSPASERSVVEPPPDETLDSLHSIAGSDVMLESCGCQANGSTASHGPVPEMPLDHGAHTGPVSHINSMKPEPVPPRKRCSTESKVLHPSERIMAKPPHYETQGSLHPLLHTDANPEYYGSPTTGLKTPERPAPKQPSYQEEDSKPPAFVGTPSASLQSPVDHTNTMRPDPVSQLKRCAMEAKALRPTESTVGKPPRYQTQGGLHPLLHTDANPEYYGSTTTGLKTPERPPPKQPSYQEEDSKYPAFVGTPSASLQSSVDHTNTMRPDPVSQLKRCAMEAKALRPTEGTVGKPPRYQTQGGLHPLLHTDANPEYYGSPTTGLKTPERPPPKQPSYQEEDSKPPAFLGTPSASLQASVDNINTMRPDQVTMLKKCAMEAKALHHSERILAKSPRDDTRGSLRCADAMPEDCDSPDTGSTASRGPVPELPLDHAAHTGPPAFLGVLPADFPLPVCHINSMKPEPVAPGKRCSMESKLLRPSERIMAKPPHYQTQGSLYPLLDSDANPEYCGSPAIGLKTPERPVPKLPPYQEEDSKPPAFFRTPSTSLQSPVHHINSMAPDLVSLLKKCAMEAKALHPSERIVAAPPPGQILDSLHPALDPATMLESCNCQDSERPLAEMPLDELSDNVHPAFLETEPAASKSGPVVRYECLENPSDESVPLEAPMEAYLYTNLWSSDVDTQSAGSEDSQAYTEIELPPSSRFPFAPGTKLVQIGPNYWLAEPMGSAHTYFVPT